MASRGLTAGSDTVYRSTPALTQRKFTSRRSNTRRTVSGRTSLRTPSLPKRQSTLTQLDFGTPTSYDDIEDTSSAYEGVEHARPRKRRRRNAEDQRQSTLTQLNVLSRVGHDGVKTEQDMVDVEHQEQLHIEWDRMLSGTLDCKPEDLEEVKSTFPETHQQSELCSLGLQRTPRISRTREIPSSQTPQSILFESRHSRRTARSLSRSPLKERNANIPAVLDIVMPGLFGPKEQGGTEPTTTEEFAPIDQPVFRKPFRFCSKRATARVVDTARQDQAPVLARYAKTKVISDSQFESLGEDIMQSRADAALSIDNASLEPGSVECIPCTFNATLDHGHIDTRNDEEVDEQDDEHGFIDPACSALSRDAERYMETQRLQGMQTGFGLPLLDTPVVDDESIAIRDFASTIIPATRPPLSNEHKEAADDLDDDGIDDDDNQDTKSWQDLDLIDTHPDPSQDHVHETPQSDPHQSTYIEVVDLTSDEAELSDIAPSSPPPPQDLPSSPPVPDQRPHHPPITASQATTVSNPRTPVAKLRTHPAPHQDEEPQPTSSPLSDPHDFSPPPKILDISSSPLVYPPSYMPGDFADEDDARSPQRLFSSPSVFSSPDQDDSGQPGRRRARKARRRTAKEILPDSLLDFSLPVPPLSSWRREEGSR